ncbi:MAG: basic amino acid ABC transporter substrate-binding protein [Clostridia bacterium]|nr:basic amino acid ABC transporter substrate-binding protein [Clostridia bacterium]
MITKKIIFIKEGEKIMKTTKKLMTLIMVIAMLAMIFSGCGSSSEPAAEEPAADVPTYHCITEASFPPFDTTDEDGNIVGFDMDLMNAIAEDQGFKVDYTDMVFDSLIPSVESHQYDIITAGMNAEDPERQKHVSFSDTYYDSALMVVVKEDSTVTSVDDLTTDMIVASQVGTTGADMCNSLADEKKIKSATIIDAFSDCMLQLKNGDVQAVIIDKPVAQAYINKIEGFKMVGEPMNAEAYGFAVAKDNTELLEKINAGLKNMMENGTYDKLLEKWFN